MAAHATNRKIEKSVATAAATSVNSNIDLTTENPILWELIRATVVKDVEIF